MSETYQEILSQPSTWRSELRSFTERADEYRDVMHRYNSRDSIFIGCGTSYYLALTSAALFSGITGKKSKAYPASDILLFSQSVFGNAFGDYLPFLISRSGTTTEILMAAGYLKSEYDIDLLGITCRENGSLEKQVDYRFLLPEADEESVVMTRSFTSMLILVQYLSALTADDDALRNELLRLPDLGATLLGNSQDLAGEILDPGQYKRFVFLGQGPYYGLAAESMLKVKEMSLSVSEAYHSLEFRHGPKSMVDEEVLITFFVSEQGRDMEVTLIKEMRELSAGVLVICESADAEIRENADYLVELKSGLSDYARLPLYMPIPQLLGFMAAVNKGLDPDHPNNLSQVVTLEKTNFPA